MQQNSDMDALFASVRLSEVDWQDESFAIHSFTAHDHLRASLERCGVLQPPWVWNCERSRHVIVDGFKRIDWLREKNREIAWCRVFPPDAERGRLLLQRIEDKVYGPPLNGAEKAQVISRLCEMLSEEEILSVFLSLLGLPRRREVIDAWCRLAAAEAVLLAAVASETISQRAALELAGWPRESQIQAASILCELRCSTSIQAEILERFSEIAVSREESRHNLLNDPELHSILTRPQWNRRQKTQALRELLYTWRFPRLRAREQRFSTDLAKAGLPQGVKLYPPPAFEGCDWKLQIVFSHPEELQGLLKKVEGFAGSPQLHELLKS